MQRLRIHVTAARLGIAVAALFTFVAVLALVAHRGRTVEVWVVARPVAPGSMLEPESLTPTEVGADSPLLPSLMVVTERPPEGVALVALSVGRPLLVGDLADGPVVPPRTLALETPSAVIVALGLAEGDRVDVLASPSDRSAGSGGAPPAVVVAADLRVAAVSEADGPVRSAGMVVVEVTAVQALDLAASAGIGDVVVVRSTGVAGSEGRP